MMTTTFDSRLFDEPNRDKARKLLGIYGSAASVSATSRPGVLIFWMTGAVYTERG